MSCQLRFTAEEFDVDAYLEGSSLEPHEIFKKGDYQQTALESWITQNAGFCVETSAADFDNFAGQLSDTIEFIQQHKRELEELGKLHNRVDFCFDFGLETTLFNEDIFVQDFRFPIHFLSLLTEIKAELVVSYYYPTSDEEAED